MSREQRKLFAEGLIQLANIVAGALVFGQFVSDRFVDFGVIAIGIIFTFVFYFGAYLFSKEEGRNSGKKLWRD